MSISHNALQSTDRIATGQNLIKSVADDLKIVITADSRRVVVDSGRKPYRLYVGKWFVINQNILALLQSNETIWAKLFEYAAGCIEECELSPRNSTRIVPRFTISLKQIYREYKIGYCVRRMERQWEIARLLSQISDRPSAIISP